MKQIRAGDTIVFDSVSRMSRNAEEGFKDYKTLYESGIILIFLNEPLINTSIFDSTKNNLLEISVQTGNSAIDDYFTGIKRNPIEEKIYLKNKKKYDSIVAKGQQPDWVLQAQVVVDIDL